MPAEPDDENAVEIHSAPPTGVAGRVRDDVEPTGTDGTNFNTFFDIYSELSLRSYMSPYIPSLRTIMSSGSNNYKYKPSYKTMGS